MHFATRFIDWLETRWVAPAYSGWLLSGLALFFFLAASNTLAGWLYVISGMIIALDTIAACLAERNLRGLQVSRLPIYPVSAGDDLTVEIQLVNPTAVAKTLIQVDDLLPYVLGQPVKAVVEKIAAQSTYLLVYQHSTKQRGVYRWQTVQLRTAAPLGLFWRRQSWSTPARAIVYPQVLPLTHCPLVDEIGQSTSLQINSDQRARAATEGLTKSLRPYRWGDPTRLIHWRTSARYGELRVRELELLTGGQDLIIGLDSASVWETETFEAAVIAAASLYFYAAHSHLNVSLWTAGTGLIRGEQRVLETLAAAHSSEVMLSNQLPTVPIVWLTQNTAGLTALPQGSRWVLWRSSLALMSPPETPNLLTPGIVIKSEQPLQLQLQSLLGRL